jgi:hypothetical protein
VPQPQLAATGRELRLSHALVASDLSPRYLGFWPLVSRAWREIAGLEPLLVLVAAPDDVPDELRDDGRVHVFTPLDGVHTAFQAQCIRLLYPALLATEGAVLTSDMDMAPLNAEYFHGPTRFVDRDHFLAYRDVLLESAQVPICYNAALPSTWAAVFGISTIDDVRARLAEWSSGLRYTGTHGADGWASDQLLLYRTLIEHARRTSAVWILDDRLTGFRRLERGEIAWRDRLSRAEIRRIRRGAYSDYHCALPYDEHRDLNDLVVELASSSGRRGISGRARRGGARRGRAGSARTPDAARGSASHPPHAAETPSDSGSGTA